MPRSRKSSAGRDSEKSSSRVILRTRIKTFEPIFPSTIRVGDRFRNLADIRQAIEEEIARRRLPRFYTEMLTFKEHLTGHFEAICKICRSGLTMERRECMLVVTSTNVEHLDLNRHVRFGNATSWLKHNRKARSGRKQKIGERLWKIKGVKKRSKK